MTSRAADISRSLAEDIQSIRKRVEKLVKGDVRMVDIDTQQGLLVMAGLTGIAATLRSAIIPAKE